MSLIPPLMCLMTSAALLRAAREDPEKGTDGSVPLWLLGLALLIIGIAGLVGVLR